MLLIAAGLRHHLVWGETSRLPFSLRPLLDAFETLCLVGFAWSAGLAWLRGMDVVRNERPDRRRILRASLPLLVAAVAVPPFLSLDIADYVMRGRIVAVHGGNPYVDLAATYTGDPFLAFGDSPWKRFPLPYGPVIADLNAGIVWLAGLPKLPVTGELVLAIALFKLVLAACLVGAAFAARSLCSHLRPEAADVAFLSVLWNPLLLSEGVATAHNDTLVMLTILLAARAAVALRSGRSAVALGAGMLCKIVPVLLGPLFLLWSVRTRTTLRFVAGSCVAGALIAGYWLRYFRPPGALDFLRLQSSVTGASPVWAVAEITGLGVPLVLTLGRVIVAAIALVVAARAWQRPSAAWVVRGSAVVLAAMVMFGLAVFGPWYHMWWIPLALVHGAGFLHRFAIAASLTAPLGYVLWTALRTLDERHQWAELSMGIAVPLLAAAFWRRRTTVPAAPPVAGRSG